ncbi:zinc finger protein 541 isoform X2 [Hyla sarda]|nr:zinc finger protein 541 isoform X2 [Hyla sarda]XP_056395914.1 zinc finger protein 541 isoform X2 [Hyla sarda]XP_056395915.1 zinc finger protein 541 isoform X2 [Hyla sarda]
MDLYSLNDEHCLQPEDYCNDGFQPMCDILQPELSDRSSGSATTMFSDNLGRIEESLPSADMMSSVNNKWDADLGLIDAEDSVLLLNKPCKEKVTALDCKVCRKVFYNASSLSKHMVTHSEKRNHICRVCKKAFKRQDHLMGHMLTHLKVKPFVCTESGCNKSYCDFRSLRRHFDVHHGLLIKQQQEPATKPCLIPTKVLETESLPPVLTNNEIMRCPVNQFIQQKVTSDMVVLQDPMVNNVSQMMTFPSMSNDEFASMTTCASIHSSSKVSVDPDNVRCSNPSADNTLWDLLLKSQKIKSVQDQPNSYSPWAFDEASVNREYIENSAGYLNSLDYRHMAPPASSGHEAMRVQYLFTCETDFTRLTIQPSQNSEFQVQNAANFIPTNSQPEISQTAPLSLPRMSIPQYIPETNGTRGSGDRQIDPQVAPTLSSIIGVTENRTSESQTGPEKVTGQENRQLSSNNSETWPKPGRFHCKSAINKEKLWFNLSSIVSPSQAALESFMESNKFQGTERMYRLSISNQGDIGKESVGISQHKVEPTASTLESGSWTTKRTTVGQLVIPVSVPFSETDQQKRETVITHTTKKGKKKSSCPKSLYIPPPVVENTPTSSGSFQSTMRSPHTPLSDLLNGALQHQYTPPPMLSPIRRGTGLYFNTFCSASSAKYQPPSLIKKETGEFFFVKDNIEFSVQPHINIGDQFQAVIPECRDQLGLEREEEKADLVWRPCLDNEAMSNFVNLACSSAVPGGGHNLELGLHCLYFSQGNILEALDKLLVKGPLKLLLPRCLANYHYAGSDHWSAAEKRQFKKAYSKEGKDFSYIQSMIPGKSVHQCVEYYYTWKTILSFERRQTPEQTLSAEQSFSGEEPHGKKEPHTGVKVKSKKQKKNGEPKGNPPFSQNESRDGEYPIKFVCPECNRVFEKVKSRNAHMKIHRLQEQKR